MCHLFISMLFIFSFYVFIFLHPSPPPPPPHLHFSPKKNIYSLRSECVLTCYADGDFVNHQSTVFVQFKQNVFQASSPIGATVYFYLRGRSLFWNQSRYVQLTCIVFSRPAFAFNTDIFRLQSPIGKRDWTVVRIGSKRVLKSVKGAQTRFCLVQFEVSSTRTELCEKRLTP